MPLSSIGNKMDNATVRIVPVCNSEHQLFALMCVYVARQSLSTVITACLVASDPVVTHATTKSMMCYVVLSSSQALRRRVSRIALAMVNVRME